jgi:hypothetical protein
VATELTGQTASASIPRVRSASHNGNGLAGHAAPAALARPQVEESVISEMSHELGNFFHKLYYWAEYLRSEAAPSSADAPAAEMLERTIKNLEGFLKVAMHYFAPIEVSPIRMTADDVVESFVGQLSARMCGLGIDVRRDGDLAAAAILVDPGRISQALDIAGRHVAGQVGDASTLEVTLVRAEYADRPCVELRAVIRRPVEDSPFFQTAEAGIELALMEKLLALHGGGVCQQAVGDRARGLSVFIPVIG